MSNIYFDIETIPAQEFRVIDGIKQAMKAELDQAMQSVRAPGNYKKPDAIAEYVEAERAKLVAEFDAKVDEAINRTGLDGTYGQVFCIAWAVDDNPVQWVSVADDLSASTEAHLLRSWFTLLNNIRCWSSGRRPVLIGHNSNEFDIPFIWKRAVIHGVKPPIWWPKDPKPWGDSTVDTMTMWAGAKGRISMDKLCAALGIPGKEGMSGKDVWPAVQRGEHEKVVNYCKDDVERTRQMHKRMTFNEGAAL